MNVIIQAGGKGTRLHHHTRNKPKCLVTAPSLTLLEKQLKLYSSEDIIIIGDYKYDVLEKYVKTFFPKYKIKMVNASGKTGTLSGLAEALSLINNQEEIHFFWSDLILGQKLTHRESDIQVFTTNEFPCRYRLSNNLQIEKITSSNDGIIGAFTIKNKNVISDVPSEGSFVSGWLKDNLHYLKIVKTNISYVDEVGTLESLEKQYQKDTSRFFNKVEKLNGMVYKQCIDDKYSAILENEKDWYKHIQKTNFKNVPQVFSFEPFIMEEIMGFQCHDENSQLTKERRTHILQKICSALHSLHNVGKKPANQEHVEKFYRDKTVQRVLQVQSLIPFFDEEELIINGKSCDNPFAKKHRAHFIQKLENVKADYFCVIHGDPTFNNIIIGRNDEPFFFDPRGTFASEKIYGDPVYDWAKLYYSVVTNYDSVNEKRFKLEYFGKQIDYQISSSGWEELELNLLAASGAKADKIFLLVCAIWFSLCGYDTNYDTILMSFVKGVELWQKVK